MIIFDLDGCLANCEHRRHFVDFTKVPHTVRDGSCFRLYPRYYDEKLDKCLVPCDPNWKPNWPAFYEACDRDDPIKPVFDILDNLWRNEVYFEIWTGRCESVREKTIHFLCKYSPGCKLLHTYNESDSLLKMRPIGDSTPDDKLKERWLDEAIAEGKSIDFVFDDRPKVVRMWRRRGVFVFNCAQHDKEF